MSTYKCNCENDPSVAITFGSRNPKETCDTIVPLGLVLPSAEELNQFYLTIVNQLASTSPHYYGNYKDNPRLEKLKFKISVGYCTIESFTIRIVANGVYDIITPITQITSWDTGKEVQQLPCGDYLWEWDGYANLQQLAFTEKNPEYKDEFGNDVLNTKFLKREKICIHIKYKWANGSKEAEVVKQLQYSSIADRGDWLDVSVMRATQLLRLHARVLCPTRKGVSEKYGRSLGLLRQMAQKGIEIYWRRSDNDMKFDDTQKSLLYWLSGTPGSGEHLHKLRLRTSQGDWTMHARAEVLDSEKEKWFNTTYLGLGYDRRSQSEAPGRNLSWEQGADRYQDGTVVVWPEPHSDNWFMHTAAHEFGHHVLKDAYNKDRSYGHKGTSSWMGDSKEGLPAYWYWLGQCAGGLKIEFDLMRYYSNPHHEGHLHCRINNDDARGAVWLTKPRFRLKNIK